MREKADYQNTFTLTEEQGQELIAQSLQLAQRIIEYIKVDWLYADLYPLGSDLVCAQAGSHALHAVLDTDSGVRGRNDKMTK